MSVIKIVAINIIFDGILTIPNRKNMLKKIGVLGMGILFSNLSFAVNCEVIEKLASKTEAHLIPRWGMSVISPHRVYFHSAPNDACKMKDVFIIKNDHVTAYTVYNDGRQDWVSVMYFSQRLGDTVQGWAKFNAFKKTGTMSPEQ